MFNYDILKIVIIAHTLVFSQFSPISLCGYFLCDVIFVFVLIYVRKQSSVAAVCVSASKLMFLIITPVKTSLVA